MANTVAVLVLSCDKYADLWPGFFACFKRYFPLTDLPVYLGSNTLVCAEPGVTTLLSGEDRDWSSSYIRVLDQVPHRKLFVILEDLFLATEIDRTELERVVDFMIRSDAIHIRYWGNPPPDSPVVPDLLGETARGAPYRATVCGFWDRDYLRGLLLPGENPWNFEIMGSYRTAYSDGFYALNRPLCEYRNLVEKGCWIPRSLAWARENGLPVRVDARPVLVGGNQVLSRFKMIIFDLMIKVPWRYRVRAMAFLRKLFISY